MNRIFFISAGQLNTKKERNISNIKNMYLNYGLLSLATVVKKAGYDSIVFHGNFTSPNLFLDNLISEGLLKTQYPIYISIPSYYALTWTQEITSLIKAKLNNKIIIGGRWVIDGDVNRLKLELPHIDEVVPGLGENKILKTITGIDDYTDYNHSPPDYTLLNNRQYYQPSIEVSRGCGRGCDFCQEKDEPLQNLKSPILIVNEYKNLLIKDNFRDITPYFEASLFTPTEKWLKELISAQKESQSFFWRAECRVDSLSNRLIPLMAQAGMAIIDLGLESASPIQLSRMAKSKTPEKYLNRASELLRLCYKNGIKTKVNIMLYAGENEDTLNETRTWLNAHKEYIYGVSCGVVSAFGWEHNKQKFIEKLCGYGATVCEEKSFTGVTNFHLSDTLCYQDSIAEAKKLSKEFMTMEKFFYLKAFSYYPRDYTFDQFKRDIDIEKGNYSFDY